MRDVLPDEPIDSLRSTQLRTISHSRHDACTMKDMVVQKRSMPGEWSPPSVCICAASKRGAQPGRGLPQRQGASSLPASALLSKHLVQAKMEAADSLRRLKYGPLLLYPACSKPRGIDVALFG